MPRFSQRRREALGASCSLKLLLPSRVTENCICRSSEFLSTCTEKRLFCAVDLFLDLSGPAAIHAAFKIILSAGLIPGHGCRIMQAPAGAFCAKPGRWSAARRGFPQAPEERGGCDGEVGAVGVDVSGQLQIVTRGDLPCARVTVTRPADSSLSSASANACRLTPNASLSRRGIVMSAEPSMPARYQSRRATCRARPPRRAAGPNQARGKGPLMKAPFRWRVGLAAGLGGLAGT
jgi:hypothetical protein